MDAHAYQYESINENVDFRIVILLPGTWEDEIACRLERHALSKKPAYETISYAWGSMRDTKSINLEGFAVQISANLEAALRHLRRQKERINLWADSLCINQGNDTEKARQVALMGQIYQGCTKVYIWLGLPVTRDIRRGKTGWFESKSSPGATIDPYSILHHFANDKHISDLPCFRVSRLRRSKLVFSKTVEFQKAWCAFMEACRSPWWSRFWCVQESLLPREAEVVFGQWRIAWRTIQKAAMNHRKHLTTCCSGIATKMPDAYFLFYDSLVLDPYQLQIADSLIGSSARELKGKYDPTSSRGNLDWVLRSYRHKACKDPRDKVFGILGLVDQAKYPDITPDYSMSLTQVFTNAMVSVIATSGGSLQCLTGSGFHFQHQTVSLPSWVRDFQARPDEVVMTYERLRFQTYRLYQACGEHLSSNAYVRDQTTLHLEGFIVDRVAKIGSTILSRDWKTIGTVLEGWHRIAGIKPVHKFEKLLHNPKQRSFWRTMTADALVNSDLIQRRMSHGDAETLSVWICSVVAAWKHLRVPKLDECYVEAILTAIYGRCFIVSEKGNFGLCYPNVEVDDEVHIVRGARVPLIVRPNKDHHKFIGESYLDGFMDGHAFKEAVPCFRDIIVQ